jgi:WD40 repeat protein
MHAERDALVTVVFPELRERLERLGLEFFDVDLRWGVPETGVDGERANSWAYCKKWIDRVEPFFVCLLGQRYGWSPPDHEIVDPADRAAYRGRSITEMEIRHAVVSGLRPRSFFYFREAEVPPDAEATAYHTFVDLAQQERLRNLKATIHRTGRPVRLYRCRWTGSGFDDLEAFCLEVLEDLWSGVLRDERYVSKDVWRAVIGHDPDSDVRYRDESKVIPRDVWQRLVEHARPAPADPLDAEVKEMAAFASARLRWFRGRATELRELIEFVEQPLATDGSRVCVVRAVPGAGKSALMARLAEQLATTSHLVISHFVGATEHSADLRDLLERLVQELDRSRVPHASELAAKNDVESLRRRLTSRLEAYAGTRRIVLLIDGVNQLTEGHDLSWLSHRLGDNVRVVLSCVEANALGTSGELKVIDALERRMPAPRRVNLPSLTENDVAEIVKDYLHEYCKELDPAEERTIVAMEQARNPLYLLVMLHELRTLGGDGMHLKVREVIADLHANHPDTISLFDWMLRRLEVFGEEAVRRWCVYLSLGRLGMSSRELCDLLGRALGEEGSKAALKIERTVRRYLQRRGTRWDFFHSQLREAVTRRYGPAHPGPYHADIASYFEGRWRDPDVHAISELPHHESRGELWDALERTLCDLTFIEAKCAAGMTHSLVTDFESALAELPETKDETDRELVFDKRVARYTLEMREYARQWTRRRERVVDGPPVELEPSLPPPPSIVRQWTDDSIKKWMNDQIGIDERGGKTASTRGGRIRAFAQFLYTENHHLARLGGEPGFCLQQAYNSTSTGPLATAAEKAVEKRGLNEVLLLQAPAQRFPWVPNPALLLTLAGHDDWISSVAVTDDARLAVSGSHDKTLRVWDLTSGSLIRSLTGHRSSIECISMTADGSLAVSGGWDTALRVWDIESGRCLQQLPTDSRVLSVAITPDGRRAVSGSFDETVRVWDLAKGACVHEMVGHTEQIKAVAITPDGRWAVSGSDDKTLRIWDLEGGSCVRTLESHWGAVYAVALTPDGRRAVSGGLDRILRVWDLSEGVCLKTLTGHDDYIQCVAVTPDGRRAISASPDKTVRVWDLTLWCQTQSLAGHQSVVSSIAVTPDGRRAVSASWDRSLRVWELTKGKPKQSINKHSDHVAAVAIVPDMKRAVSVSKDASLRIWDMATGRCDAELVGHSYGNGRFAEIEDVTLTRDGKHAVSGSKTLGLGPRVWDLATGECLQATGGPHHQGVGTVMVTPDGRRILTMGVWFSEEPVFCVWDLATGRHLQTLQKHPKNRGEGALVISPDGRRVVATDADRLIRVWDLENGRCLKTLTGHVADVVTVAVTFDGQRAISGSADGQIRVWDLTSGACVLVLAGHASAVGWVTPVPGGNYALSRGKDSISMWDLASGHIVRAFPTTEGVMSVTVSGRHLISTSLDTLKVFDLSTGHCLRTFTQLDHFTSVASCMDWIVFGTHGGTVGILRPTDGFNPGIPTVSAVRLWQFGSDGTSGRWDEQLTVSCPWCGHRFAVTHPLSADVGNIQCAAANCGRLLMLAPFACDARETLE